MRIYAALAVFAPWKLIYALMSRMPEPPGAVTLRLAWEADLPRPGYVVWPYAAAVVYALLSPLALRSLADLRRFVLTGWIVAFGGLSLFVLAPSKAPFLPIAQAGMAAEIHEVMRTFDAEWLAFPSFHSAWALLAAEVYRLRWPGLSLLWFTIVGVVGVSCVLTGSHAIADVIGGVVLAWLVWRLVAAADKQRPD